MFLGLHPKELKTYIHMNTASIRMFIAVSFLIAPDWKQPKYASLRVCLCRSRYIFTKEYYSALKRNARLSQEQARSHETCNMKWKKPVWTGSMLYESNYMTFWKRQKYWDSTQITDTESTQLLGIQEEYAGGGQTAREWGDFCPNSEYVQYHRGPFCKLWTLLNDIPTLFYQWKQICHSALGSK